MIRKPPLRTYQRKAIAQSSSNHSQAPLWATNSYFVKKLSSNDEKNKPASTSDEKYIEVSSDYLETTFDKIAKDARLPTPPSPISFNSINISSDVTPKVPSPDQKGLFEYSLKREVPKARANRRYKRKPTQARLVSEDTDVVVKKRLKHDLVNISVKKAKAVRSSKRKICSKNGKTPVNNTQKQEIYTANSSSASIEAKPITAQSKINKNPSNKKTKQGIRRKRIVRQIFSSSSEKSGFIDCSVGIYKLNPKLKTNFVSERNANFGKSRVSNGIDTILNIKSDSSKINVADKKDKKSGSVDGEQAPKNSCGALMKFQYPENPQKIRNILCTTNNSNLIDQHGCSKTGNHDEANKENLLIKPCSIVLVKYNENSNAILSPKESSVFLPPSNVHNKLDLFQSSVSKVASNVDPESANTVEISLQKSKENRQIQSAKNRSNFFHNSDISDPKDCFIRLTDCQANKIHEGNKKRDANRWLHYLKCSTPISAYVTIDKSINRLSPISLRNERQSYLENDKFSIENSITKPKNHSLMISDTDFFSSNKEYVNIIPKNNFRQRSSRKQLSISYEEDVSFEKSFEYYKKKDVKKASVENIESQSRFSLRNGNPEQMKSPATHIQKSLEILKIDLGSPNNRCVANINDKRRLPRREIFTISTDINQPVSTSQETNKYESISELTSKSKDSCSQLTPVGIITTRSGRQLKLTVTPKKKFFNDSNDPKIRFDVSKITHDSNSDSNYEIIENSENTNDRVTKYTRFSVLKSHSVCDSSDGVKLLNPVDRSVGYANNSNVKPATCTSISYESPNAKSNLGRKSADKSSEILIRNDESSSLSDDNVSAISNEQINSSVSNLTDRKMLQSIINCTRNIDSLSIRSYIDVKPEYPSSSNNGDNSNNGESITQSSSEHVESVLSDVPEITKDDSKSENQSCSDNEDGNSDASWSTITSNESSNDATSDINESTGNESMENDKLPDQLLNSSQDPSIHNKDSSEARNEETKSGNDQFLELNEVPINERIELLSTRINTRRRRRTLLKLDTKNMKQVPEEQSLVKSPKEDHEKEKEADLCDKLEDSDAFKQPSDLHLGRKLQPIVLLEKLKDPVKLPKDGNQSRGSRLTAVHEQAEKSSDKMTNSSNVSSIPDDSRVDKACDEFRKPDILHSGQKKSKMNNTSFRTNVTTAAPDSNHSIGELNASELELIQKQSLFLKPGKEWARSLSILNNIQNGLDLELSCAGKGKNWRSSVQSILSMQQERVVESCLRKNEDNKEAQPCHRASVANRSCFEDQSIGSASPSRFIRRMSIRVVPDNKKLSHIEDTSFLEAYGITASKSRKTLSTRSKLKSDQESLVCNVPYEDVGIEAVDNEHITTAKDVVLQRCYQEDYIPFTECFPNEYLEMCRKIGEGVYGEVFLYENEKEKCVIKIIPIEGNDLVNGERQKRFDEILSEIVTAKELHNLRYGENCRSDGFVEVKNIRCIHGKYPEKLIELWKAYDNDKGSDNDCPSMFNEDQLYIVLELAHGGQDLEAFVFQSAVESHAIFVQAALALAVAEQSLEFEHRDLHWGNILISYTKNSRVTYKLNDKEYSYPSKGMQVAIIDFTLSRMSYEGCCIFNDLALDPALFTAQGEYQFEVYRLMRDKVGNNWQAFEPYTNVLWLHYVLDKMITALRYKRKTTKVHKDAIFQLKKLKDVVLEYDSAFDFITNCDDITRLRCKSSTTARSTQVESNELDRPKR